MVKKANLIALVVFVLVLSINFGYAYHPYYPYYPGYYDSYSYNSFSFDKFVTSRYLPDGSREKTIHYTTTIRESPDYYRFGYPVYPNYPRKYYTFGTPKYYYAYDYPKYIYNYYY